MTAASGGAAPGAGRGWRWDVALSFAGAQREYVGQVAGALKARGVRCFYDADEQVRLWGTYLAEELPRIYARESAAVVVFISADYVGRDWTRLERRAAFSRAVAEAGVYVLPARFDDSELPGLLPDVAAVDLRHYSPVQFADLVVAKLTGLGINPSSSPPGGPGGRPLGEVHTGAADPQWLGAHAAGVPDEISPEYVPPDPDAESGARSPMAVKIGLWGPPQSGKTTYLAALPIAASDGNARNGSWNIYPLGTASWDQLEKFQKVLGEDGQFPEATFPGLPARLEWLFVGDLARSRFDRRKLQRGEFEDRFVLDLIDVHGGAYRRAPDQDAVKRATASAALDHLAEAQGIIYLFDPIAERYNRDSVAYMRGTVNELLKRATENGRRPGRYLPHQVSVCITKFDHPEMLRQALKMNLVISGDDGMPRVRDEEAEQFFDELCTGRFWGERYERSQESAQFVRDQLKQVFRPEHIRYFVTSSIGFWMEPPTGNKASPRFNPDDFANYYERDGKLGIRGKVRPINVLEPLISLRQRIARK